MYSIAIVRHMDGDIAGSTRPTNHQLYQYTSVRPTSNKQFLPNIDVTEQVADETNVPHIYPQKSCSYSCLHFFNLRLSTVYNGVPSIIQGLI